MPLRLLNLTPEQSITATPETLPKWGLHTDGAIALIKMRGKEQLNNPQSLKLFTAVRTQMVRVPPIPRRTANTFTDHKPYPKIKTARLLLRGLGRTPRRIQYHCCQSANSFTTRDS